MPADSFIGRTLEAFLRLLEVAFSSEELARRRGLLQGLDPRVKVLGTVLLIGAAATSRRLWVILGLLALGALLATASRVPLRVLATRVWIAALLFTGLIVLPAVFITPGRALFELPVAGWTVTEQGLRAAAYVISRVETTATFAVLLVLSTPWPHVLKALRVLRVPVLLVVILGMTHRYIFLMISTTREMLEARRSRLAVATAGVLLVRTLQLGEDVYLAMRSRGFRGEVYLLDDFRMRVRDWAGLAGFVSVAAAAIWAGQ